MVDTEKLAGAELTRECALCGLSTEERLVVCPEDGSALIIRKPDPLLGTTLAGKFEIVSLIGSGGMGNVYKALQKPVDRHVAVKVLHSERLQNNSSVLRFKQEAKAAATLSHPNIVTFIDYGTTDDLVPYIVMDYVDGVPLDQEIQLGTLTIERCLSVFTQASDALEHAHQKGIIHRDIKPSNLMLVKTGTEEIVKILDFGIAKMLPSGAPGERHNLTVTGEVFGSPQYMSPEQCSGSSLDARSDMFSLGCVMYESLLGRAPVRGDSLIDTIYKQTHEQPAPFKRVRPDLDIPQQLEAIVLKTLEKDPEARFPSMAALKRNLEFVPRFFEDEKYLAANPPKKNALHLVREYWDTHKWPRISAIAAVSIATIGALVWYFLADTAGSSYWEAKGKSQIAWIEMTEGSHSARLLAPTRKMRDSLTEQGKYKDALTYAMSAASLSKETEPNSQTEAADVLAVGTILYRMKDDRAHEYMLQARERFRRIAQANRNFKHWKENLASGPVGIDGRISEIDKYVAETDDAEGAGDLLGEAEDTRVALGPPKAEALYDHVVLLKQKLTKDQQSILCAGLTAMAQDEASHGKVEKAETNYKQALMLAIDVYGNQSEQVIRLQRTLGLFYQKASRFSEAEDTLLEALAVANNSLGASSQLSIAMLEDLSKLYSNMKERKKSDEMHKLAETLRTAAPESH